MINIPVSIPPHLKGASIYVVQPYLLDIKEYPDRLEMIYQEESDVSSWPPKPSKKVFKIIFSCVDGKFHKSERIYNKIQPEE